MDEECYTCTHLLEDYRGEYAECELDECDCIYFEEWDK